MGVFLLLACFCAGLPDEAAGQEMSLADLQQSLRELEPGLQQEVRLDSAGGSPPFNAPLNPSADEIRLNHLHFTGCRTLEDYWKSRLLKDFAAAKGGRDAMLRAKFPWACCSHRSGIQFK